MASKPGIADRWRAAHVEALALVRRLREAAVVFRRHAGEMKYHPQTGLVGRIGKDLLDAAMALRDALGAVTAATTRWDEEVAWLRAIDPAAPVDDVQRGHTAAREAASVAKAALEIFERAALDPERAALDAPYGHSAPRRVHPGAQCTWVAERVEDLARELSSVTFRKENVMLAIRPARAQMVQ